MELKASSMPDSSIITVHNSTMMPTPTNRPCVVLDRYESTNFINVVMALCWAGNSMYSSFCTESCRPNPRPMATISANAGTIDSTVL